MARRKLLCDIDGVIADFLSEAIRTWGEPRIPLAYTLEEIWPHVPDTEIERFKNLPTTYLRLKPLPSALQGVQTLQKAGWQIFYVTARPTHLMSETAQWMCKHQFIESNQAYLITFSRYKLEVLKAGKYNAVIEDNLETARKMAQVCPTTLLFDWPYNFGPCGRAIRVHEPHWEEVIRLLI